MTDADWADSLAYQDAEIAAGRLAPPDETKPPGPVILLGSVGADPALLSGQGFGQGGPAEALEPGPVLDALLGDAAASPALGDAGRLGAITAARRQQAYAAWLELSMIADFILGNEERFRASAARRDQRGRRDGEYAIEELGFQLGVSAREAARIADLAVDLKTRLPRTFDGMRTGAVSEEKAAIIHRRTRLLADAAAAAADEILATAAPGIRPRSLDTKARKLAYKLDPELADRAKAEGRAKRRVEAGQEESGNAYLSGRELDVAEVLAAHAALKEEARRLQRLGMPGTLTEIEAQVYTDRLNGIDTAARHGLAPEASAADDDGTGAGNGPDGSREGPDGSREPGKEEGPGGAGGPGTGSPAPGTPGSPAGGKTAPALPAVISLIVPASAAAGQRGAMSDAGAFGPLDSEDTQAVLAAASRDPRTRWCVTLVDDDTRRATAHGCAKGQHPWSPPPPGTTPEEAAAVLIRDLKPDFEPIAQRPGDPVHAESQYAPSRKLAHLIRARTATCPAPACGASAQHNELDHTVEWPDGDTSEINLSGPCVRHHHAKHARGWKLEQSPDAPGTMTWTTPSGRTFTTEPTVYDL